MLFVMVSTKNSEFFTIKAIESFLENTSLEHSDRFLVIDNDDCLVGLDRVEYHRNVAPRSFAENANFAIGLALSMDTDLVFMNNDIIYSAGWVDALRSRDDAIIIPSSNQNFTYAHDELQLAYLMDWEQFDGKSLVFAEIARIHCTNTDIPTYSSGLLMPFYCVLLPRKIVKRVGFFDETFGRAGGEDVDYRLRAMQYGFPTLYANKSYLLHFMGKATWRSGVSGIEVAANDKKYRDAFVAKWGFPLSQLFLVGGDKHALAKEFGVLQYLEREEYAQLIQTLAGKDAALINHCKSLSNDLIQGHFMKPFAQLGQMDNISPGDGKAKPSMRYALDITADPAHHGVHYLDFFEFLSKQLVPSSYLEIGSNAGDSVSRFECDAICIDPSFKISRNIIGGRERMLLFQMASDRFFANHNVHSFFPDGIDIAFLDGLHKFEFLLRDFINTEKFCHTHSVILIHDCLPYKAGISSRIQPNDDWSGDVWKILPILKKRRPDLRIVMFDTPPTGIIACTNLDPQSLTLEESFSEIVEESFMTADEPSDLLALRTLYPLLDSRRLLTKPEDLSAVLPFAYRPWRR